MSSFTRELTVTKKIITEKSKFLGLIPLQKVKCHWITEKSFRYYVGEKGSDDMIQVPKGTKTDFASVPRIFWSILPPDGIYTQSAVLHDYLYQKQVRPKYEADYIFLESMLVLGVPEWKAKIMYWAVDKFGQSSWDKHTKRLSSK